MRLVCRLPLISATSVVTSLLSNQRAIPPGVSPVTETVTIVPTGPEDGEIDTFGATVKVAVHGFEEVVILCSPRVLAGIMKDA